MAEQDEKVRRCEATVQVERGDWDMVLPCGKLAVPGTDRCESCSVSQPEETERCNAPLWVCGRATVPGHSCHMHGGPPLDSSPREATSANSAGPSLPQPPGGARIIHGPSKPDIAAIVDVLVDVLVNSIWELAEHDSCVSADLNERAAARLTAESDSDMRHAKAKSRAKAAREEKA
jgi:hypothetical protein